MKKLVSSFLLLVCSAMLMGKDPYYSGRQTWDSEKISPTRRTNSFA